MEYQQLGKRGDYSTKGPDVTIGGRLVEVATDNYITLARASPTGSACLAECTYE